MSTATTTSGYDAVMEVARTQRASWLQVIRDCHDLLARQQENGNASHVDTKWLRMSTGRRYPALTPLVKWNVIEEKVWRDAAGNVLPKSGRLFYEMPDLEGVGRALDELGIPPTTFR
jgi:hypothetical protein